MGIYTQVDNATFDQLKQWWDLESPSWALSKESFLEEVAFALTNFGLEGVNFLKSCTTSGSIEQRREAIYFLANGRFVDDEIITYLIDAFHDTDNGLRQSALWGFGNLDRFLLNPHEVERLMNNEDDRLAASAMVYLSRACPEEAVEILRGGLVSSNSRKREYACDEIGDRYILELRSALSILLTDTPPIAGEGENGDGEGAKVAEVSKEEVKLSNRKNANLTPLFICSSN